MPVIQRKQVILQVDLFETVGEALLDLIHYKAWFTEPDSPAAHPGADTEYAVEGATPSREEAAG